MHTSDAKWRRLTVLLPVNNAREVRAYDDVCRWLESRVTGFTKTTPTPSVFQGIWKGEHEVYLDNISMLIIDIPISYEYMLIFCEEIKSKSHKAYTAVGSTQEEFWVTAEDMVLPVAP